MKIAARKIITMGDRGFTIQTNPIGKKYQNRRLNFLFLWASKLIIGTYNAYLSLYFLLSKISRSDFCVTFLSSPGRTLSSVHFLFLHSLSFSALCLRSLSSACCMYGELTSSSGSFVPDLLHSSRKGTNMFLLDLLMNAITAPWVNKRPARPTWWM